LPVELHASYPEYLWYPQVLGNVSASAERLGIEYFHYRQSNPTADATKWVKHALTNKLGVEDASDEEIALLVDHPELSPYTFADIVSRRAQTGWSTHGHSAADVNIYASSAKGVEALVGNHENTEVGEFLASYLELDVKAITKELNDKGTELDAQSSEGHSWMGRKPQSGERLDGQDHLDHYTGDFKKHKRCEICGV
jgi:alkaline phosphatase